MKSFRELKHPPNPNLIVEHITQPLKHDQYDYITKVILIGDSAVGKSSILRMFTESKFEINPVSTMGIDFSVAFMKVTQHENNDQSEDDQNDQNDQHTEDEQSTITNDIGKYLILNNRKSGLRKQIKTPIFKFQVWDTSGQERFHSIVKSYIRGANIIIYTFDITDSISFAKVERWKRSVEDEIGTPEQGGYMCVLVGNKIDVENYRQVSRKNAEKLASTLDTVYFEVSARNDSNIEEMFEEITKIMYCKMLNGTLEIEHRTIGYTNASGISIASTRTPLADGANKCFPGRCNIS